MTVREQFIERGTDYTFRNGTISIYETNCPCKNVEFNFERYMITVMVSGHKTVVSEKLNVEFFPGMLFIPEKDTIQKVEIANASFTNPTKCLVLDISPAFLETFYLEYQNNCREYEVSELALENKQSHFFSNEQETINTFIKLYKNIRSSSSSADEMINTITLKELLSRLMLTEAKELLLKNFQERIQDRMVEKTINYIKLNFKNKITIDELAEISGAGKTKFFNAFKNEIGLTPVNYIMQERIHHAEKLMKTTNNMQSIAFHSGFNTYEHFYKSFKKIWGCSPKSYKKNIKELAEAN